MLERLLDYLSKPKSEVFIYKGKDWEPTSWHRLKKGDKVRFLYPSSWPNNTNPKIVFLIEKTFKTGGTRGVKARPLCDLGQGEKFSA